MIIRTAIAAALVLQIASPSISLADEQNKDFIYRTGKTGIIPSHDAPSNPDPETPPQTVFYPDIADQAGVMLGAVGQQITPWTLKGQAGWSAAVVEKSSRSAWDKGALTFSANHDLSQYGLHFNTATGGISGTPTAGFDLSDFRITVSSDGRSDTTAPFSVGAAEPAQMYVSASQTSEYGLRLGDMFATDPINVYGAVGDVAFAAPGNLRANLDWSTTTGILSGTWSNAAWVGAHDTYTTTLTDHLGRSIPWSFAVTYRDALLVGADASRAYNAKWAYDAASTSVLVTRPKGIYGSPDWTVTGLPAGLHFDTASGKILGKPTGGPETAGPHEITFKLTDGIDGRTTEQKANLSIEAPFTYLYLGIDETPQAILKNGAAPAKGISVRTEGNYAYTPVLTWSLESGAFPPGITHQGNLVFAGSATATGTYTVRMRGTDPEGFSRVTSPLTFVVTEVVPDIADQTNTVLGEVNKAIVSWSPVAASGWVSAVVEKVTRGIWSGSTLVYSTNYDLTQYGLSFNTSTGNISGTPTRSFVLSDFTITAAANGSSDTTAPFKISITAPPLAVAAGQTSSYSVRLNASITTTPIALTGAQGTVTYSAPPNLRVGFTWDSAAGVLSGTWTTSAWGGLTDTYTTTITDGDGRSVTRTFTLKFQNVTALAVTGTTPDRIFLVDRTYTAAGVNWSLGATGVYGTATWSVSGLPNGLTFDLATKKIIGRPTGTSDIQGLHKVVFTVTDDFDGTVAAATLNATIEAPFTYLYANGGSAATITLGAVAPTNNINVRGDGNVAYGKVMTWVLASGSLPPGFSFNASAVGLTFTGTASAKGTYSSTFKGTDPNGFTRIAVPYVFTVQ
jgi:hypothetical protein